MSISTTSVFMKNIQVIDAAVNCVYDIFAATDEEFALVFPNGQDIAFIDEIYGRGADNAALDSAFEALWTRRVVKAQAISMACCSTNSTRKSRSIRPGVTRRQRTQVATAFDRARPMAGRSGGFNRSILRPSATRRRARTAVEPVLAGC